MANKDALIKKIEKLLLKANDPAATDAERELFHNKAATLMVEYGIVEAELSEGEELSASAVNRYSLFTYTDKSCRGFVRLVSRLSDILGGSMFFRPSYDASEFWPSGKEMVIYATESRWQDIRMWYEHLASQLWADLERDRPRGRQAYAVAWAEAATLKFREFYGDAWAKQDGPECKWLPAIRDAETVKRAENPDLRTAKYVNADSASGGQGSLRGREARLARVSISGQKAISA